MNIKNILVTVCLSLLIIGYLLIDKRSILNILTVDGDYFNSADLLVVLEGGAVRFAPTRERANKAIELYKQFPSNVLVCAYRKHKNGIIKYLSLNGVRAEDFYDSYYEYEGKEGGGTYNNVLEIISVIKENNKFQNIVIVTSPYHELRVSLILSELINEAEIGRVIYIKYADIKTSEVINTDIPRFIRIIFHEFIGISGFYAKFVIDKF